jgi:hypothetical protein
VIESQSSRPAPIGTTLSSGYPIVYMLDAGGSFATMVEAIRARCRRPDATGVGPAFVVGIGMHGGEEVSEGAGDRAEARLRRTRDYTPGPSLTPDNHSIPGGAQSSGGAKAFREFIEQELIPRIEQGIDRRSEQGLEQGLELGAWTEDALRRRTERRMVSSNWARGRKMRSAAARSGAWSTPRARWPMRSAGPGRSWISTSSPARITRPS